MKTRSITMVLVGFVAIMTTTTASYANLALGASYSYSAGWPWTPGVWGDTAVPSILTDGNDGSSGSYGTSVYENGNEILCVFNIDLGQDCALTQLKALAVQSPWGNNALANITFFVRTEASGVFTAGYSTLASEADWSMGVGAVDKTNPVWVLDTGAISVTGRYISVWANGDGIGYNAIGLTEIQAVPEPMTMILLGLGGLLLKQR